MDPISGSIGVSDLITGVNRVQNVPGGNATVNITHYFNAELTADFDALKEQVSAEKQDLEVYMCILEEVKTVFDTSSTDFPPSVLAALKSCTARNQKLEQLLTDAEPELESSKATELKYKQLLKAFDAFHKSVLLFRDLVIG
jgi:hypothetical protein